MPQNKCKVLVDVQKYPDELWACIARADLDLLVDVEVGRWEGTVYGIIPAEMMKYMQWLKLKD